MLCSYLLSKFIFLVKLELLYLIKFVVKNTIRQLAIFFLYNFKLNISIVISTLLITVKNIVYPIDHLNFTIIFALLKYLFFPFIIINTWNILQI